MKSLLRSLSFVPLLAALAFGQTAKPVGEFENHLDIGAPKITGSAVYDAATKTYTFTAGGTNMWATRDEFHFAFKKIKGDFIVRARIEFVGQGVDPHRKLGWIARATLDADSPYVDGAEHGNRQLTSLQVRKTKGAITEQTQLKTTGADILQLERRGNTYIFSAAKNGETLESAEIKDFDLGEEPYVGLFLCSHNPDVKEQAIFHDVRITKPAKTVSNPSTDFIGGKLGLVDFQNGTFAALYSAKERNGKNEMREGLSTLALFQFSAGQTSAHLAARGSGSTLVFSPAACSCLSFPHPVPNESFPTLEIRAFGASSQP